MPRAPPPPGTTLGDLPSIAAPQTSIQDPDLLGVAVQSQTMTDAIPPNAGATMKTATVTTPPRIEQATVKTAGVLPGSARHMLPPPARNLGIIPPTMTTTHPTDALAPLTGTGAPTSMAILTTMSEARDNRTPPAMITRIVSLGATTMITGVQGGPTEAAADLVTARKDPTPEITIAPRPRTYPRIQPLRPQSPQRPERLWKDASRRGPPPLASEADEDEDRLETLARASGASRSANGLHAVSSRDPHSARPSNHRLDHNSTPQTNGHSRPHREDRFASTSRSSLSPVPPSKSFRPDSTSTASTSRPRPESANLAHIADPPTREPPPAPSRSFGHVLLPHELDAEQRDNNAMTLAPRDKSGYVQGKYPLKSAADKQLLDAKVIDPRKGRKLDFSRDGLHPPRFIWDANSVGTKPLPPPRNLVVTGFSALTPPSHLLPHIRPFGRILSSKLEMHPAIGQSLGIFCVTFAHDFDEDGKPVKDLPDGQDPQNGAKAAKAAQLALNGRQIGQYRVATLLDRAGEVVAEQVKLKIATDQAKHRPPPSAAASTAPMSASSRPSQSNMPPPDKPRAPRPSMDAAPSSHLPASSSAPRSGQDRLDARSPRWTSSKPQSRADDAPRWDRPSSSADSFGRRRHEDERDSRPSRSYSSLRSEGIKNATSAGGQQARPKALPKLPTADILDMLRVPRRPHVFIPKPKSCNVLTEDITEQLATTQPLWTMEGDDGWYVAFSTKSDATACKFVNETLTIGGYTLQVHVRDPPAAAPPTAQPADPTSKPLLASAGASSTSRTAAAAPAEPPRKSLDSGLRPLTAEEKQKTEWTEPELQDAVFRMLQKELADTFLRDVKSRIVVPHLTSYLKPDGEGFQLLAKTIIKKPAFFSSKSLDRGSSMDKADKEARLPSFRKVATAKTDKSTSERDAAASKAKSKHDQPRAKKHRDPATKSKDRRGKVDADDESEDIEDFAPSKRSGERARSTKSGVKKRGAAAWLLESTDEEAESDDAASTGPDATSRSVSASVEPSQNETDTKKKSSVKAGTAVRKKGTAAAKKSAKSAGRATPEDSGEGTATPEVEAVLAKTKPKAAAKARPIPADPFEAGLVEDAEDLYFLRLALDQLRGGELPTDESWPEEDEPEAAVELKGVPEAPAPHLTGAARTEGMYRIAPAHKAAHLPDRNKATEETEAGANAQVLQSARNNRADSRRLVLGIEQHKRETATDTDMFKFNQLRTRKKQLKFAKSPIHDWGLYAMELIPAGDMVIEYVGEVVRQQVADEREKQYERQGNFSTYLFRVDDDLVVDATHKGNIARLMNHCCTPNCNAKILTLNGEKRIVLFAKSPIRPGEELTYDYKFQSSADDEDAIPCLCGSPGCRRFL
ncbi:histone H3 (Lys4) methyltransferase complex, subunit SET1 [Moesziomyces antarcticus T-34]|uniref:Histone-lysine N-methyltransferase, H3 lysine-4 specific n=1 Tax=Pseudozyma antarctica (strain T-34) TaxID=1151754 RepID=M9LXS9_PSEA3|nr:histone H3 (Lys4) methyltransferase complex, subunit SET1 [Moesziomyces antarcticus T-34]